jgi:hypothetical protein
MPENANPQQSSTGQSASPQNAQGQAGQSQGQSSQVEGNQAGYSPSDDQYEKGQSFKEDPEWKKAQRGYTKTINQLQQQLNELQSQAEAQRMEGMSDLEKANYAAEQWRQQALQAAQRAQEFEMREQRRKDLGVINQYTGVPVHEIESYLDENESNSAQDAWTWAMDRARNSNSQFSQQQEQGGFGQQGGRQQPPPVNVGGGPTPGEGTELQRRYDEAKSLYNMGEMIAVMQEAGAKGIELQE